MPSCSRHSPPGASEHGNYVRSVLYRPNRNIEVLASSSRGSNPHSWQFIADWGKNLRIRVLCVI